MAVVGTKGAAVEANTDDPLAPLVAGLAAVASGLEGAKLSGAEKLVLEERLRELHALADGWVWVKDPA